MNVLTATHDRQPGDFTWTVEGEIVTPPWQICDRDDCGCDRAFMGLASHRATTTARVSDLDITRDQLNELIAEHLERAGLAAAHEDLEAVEEITDRLVRMADTHPVGAVISLVTPTIAVARR